MDEHLLLISGYGAPGQEDMALYALQGSHARKLNGMRHGRGPSFCCKGENGLIYVASERSDGADITAYALEGDCLREIRSLPVPGSGLCHLYALGSVLYACCFETGHYLAVDEQLTQVLWQYQPEHAHAHWSLTVDGKLYLMDLGNDCIYRFALHDGLPSGAPEILAQPEGSGPRQVLVSPDRHLTCVCELDGMVRILDNAGRALGEVNPTGAAEPRNYPGGACYGAGSTLYVCNRGPNTLSACLQQGTQLNRVAEWATGDWPRYVTYVPGNGLLLVACNKEGEVRGYNTNVSPVSETFRLPLAGASCVLLLS